MSRRGPATLAIAGIVVLIGAIALWLAMRDGEPATAEPSGTGPATDRVASETPAPAERGPSAVVTPSLPRDSVPTTDPAAKPREYMIGDTLVRDHRKGDHAPIDIPPSIHPPDGRKIHSNLTNEIAMKVRVGVADCAASVPPEARGVKPRVEGQVVIAIKDKRVTVTSTTMQLRDVVGASVDATRQCIEQKAMEITHTADEADLESYDLNMSFAL